MEVIDVYVKHILTLSHVCQCVQMLHVVFQGSVEVDCDSACAVRLNTLAIFGLLQFIDCKERVFAFGTCVSCSRTETPL